jgi:hypothetical protein
MHDQEAGASGRLSPHDSGTRDRISATRFLDCLGSAEPHTFQTFDDSKGSTPRAGLIRVLHGRFEEHEQRLGELNDAGAGVFVMVNAGDGEIKQGARTCRTAANVVRIRALFVDLDGAPIAPVLRSALPPDWVVQSSPQRWHAYWSVRNCTLVDFTPAQSALAFKFGGDPTVKDLPRVMRVPGFVHRKATPFTSELYLPSAYTKLLGGENE